MNVRNTVLLVALCCLSAALSPRLTSAEYTNASGQRVCDIYIDDALTNVRAVYVNWKRGSEAFNGVNLGSRRQYEDQEWRDFLASLGVASMIIDGMQGSDNTALDGGGQFILDSLNSFAAQSGHPELAHAPILIWGHSKSAGFAATFADAWPQRTVGFIQFHGNNNNSMINEAFAVGDVPALLLAGQVDGTLDPQGTLDMIVQGRALTNIWGGGSEIGLPHGGGTNAAYYVRKTIVHPWILSVINKRLPAALLPYTTQPTLQLLGEFPGHLGDQGTLKVSSGSPASNGSFTTAEYSIYTGNKSEASWLADAAYAKVWKAYFQSGDAAGLAVKTVLVSAVDPIATETGVSEGRFTLTRSGDISAPLTVNYSTSGSALPGGDYPALPGSATIPAGASSVSIYITAFNDGVAEPDETVTVTVSTSPNYEVCTPNAATVVIAGNGGSPALVATISATDSAAGEPSNPGQFTVTLSPAPVTPVNVNLNVSGTAAAGSDYTALPASVSVGSSGTATIPVNVIDDAAIEGSETVVATITAGAGYTVGSPSAGTVTIADNDSVLPTVTASATDSAAAEPAATGTFTFTRTGSTAAALTVNYSVAGTATSGSDYTSLGTSISIPAGSASTTRTVTPIDDSTVESAETVILTLSSNAAYTVGSPDNGTVTIADNDSATPVTVTLVSQSGNDGYVTESTETSNTGGSNAAAGTGSAALRVGDTATDQQVKTILSFDTSSIPDGATITAVTIRLQRGSVNGTSPFGTHGQCRVDIKSGAFGAVTLENSDFEAAADSANVAALSTPAANGDWASGSLSAPALALINKTGTTQFRVYFQTDDNNDNSRDDVGFFPGEATAGTRPELIVTYTP